MPSNQPSASASSQCPTCNDTGKVRGFLGLFTRYCPDCAGVAEATAEPTRSQDDAVRSEQTPSQAEVDRLLAEAGDDEAMVRIRALAGLSKVKTERALDEMIQVAGLDYKGEVRIAAICGLASREDRDRTERRLVYWMDRFGENSTSGGNPKWSPALALAIMRGNDVQRALAESFDGKQFLLQDLGNANQQRAKPGADRIAFLLTWFTSIDAGHGFPLYIERAHELFPEHRPILEGVRRWMAGTL
jgi:hypothetical protein